MKNILLIAIVFITGCQAVPTNYVVPQAEPIPLNILYQEQQAMMQHYKKQGMSDEDLAIIDGIFNLNLISKATGIGVADLIINGKDRPTEKFKRQARNLEKHMRVFNELLESDLKQSSSQYFNYENSSKVHRQQDQQVRKIEQQLAEANRLRRQAQLNQWLQQQRQLDTWDIQSDLWDIQNQLFTQQGQEAEKPFSYYQKRFGPKQLTEPWKYNATRPWEYQPWKDPKYRPWEK